MEIKENNGRLEVDLPAALDLPAAAELRDLLLDALSRDTSAELVLKANEVERIATACVQVLLAAQAGFKGAARRLEIEGATAALTDSFKLLGLEAEMHSFMP